MLLYTKEAIMARKANPYTAIIKRMHKIQAKAEKLNTEIELFRSCIEAQAKQYAVTAKKQVVKKANAASKKTIKKAPAKAKNVKKTTQNKKP